MFTMIFIYILNLVFSICNAFFCGQIWKDAVNGFQWLVKWSVATMSAVGFSWCFLMPAAFLGSKFGLLAEGTAALALGYGALIFIPLVVLTGIIITLNSWRMFFQSKSLGDGLVAGWNTYAQVHNTYNAVTFLPDIFKDVLKASTSSEKDSKSLVAAIVLALGAVSLGVLITRYIILTTAYGA